MEAPAVMVGASLSFGFDPEKELVRRRDRRVCYVSENPHYPSHDPADHRGSIERYIFSRSANDDQSITDCTT